MTNRLILLTVLFASFAHASTQKIDSEWKGFSSPEIMSSGFTNSLKNLPLEGTVQIGPKYWSSSYWPSKDGGINTRWNTPKPEGFKYDSPNIIQAKNMSLAELATLSPTEKYDIYIGRFDYPTRAMTDKTVDKGAPDWAGICHGWSPASVNHNEPTPKVLTSADGIQVPFGSADIKGLLSFYYAHYHESETTSQVGLRCSFGGWLGGTKACDDDLNAGAFHIVIANMLGLRKEGFIADVDRYKEVWNQPVTGYKSTVLESNMEVSPRAAKSAVRQMKIATDFYYVDESDHLTWEPVHGTKEQIIATRKYEYTIEIDARGNIVGGEWISKERPDFLWKKEKAPGFEGILSHLTDLLND